jgi:hypothetical protein
MAGASEIHWRITFENVQDPGEMKVKLQSSVTLRRCTGVAVHIEGADIVCSFLSSKSEQNIKRDVCQTYRSLRQVRALYYYQGDRSAPKFQNLEF